MILLVENEENDVVLLKRALHKVPWNEALHVSTNAQDAMDYLGGVSPYADRSAYPIPSIIFIDLKLPGMHGFELMEWIRKQPALIAMFVVVLTASPEAMTRKKAMELGAAFFLVKPPSAEMLRGILA